MNPKYLSAIMLLSLSATAADQIEIANNTNQTLNLNLPIPAHTAAFIQMKKLGKSQEELQGMLHAAILKNSAEGIREAIHAGANVNEEKEGKTPLLWAVLLKRTNAVAALLEHAANVKKENNLVMLSLQLGDVKSALLLVKNGADFLTCDSKKQDAMHYALEMLQKNQELNTTLEFILELMNQKYDVKYLEPILASLNRNCNRHSTSEFSAAQSFVSSIYMKLWHCAIKNSNSLVNLKDFIKHGAPINITSTNGGIRSFTPLLLAISENKKTAIKILLEAGADVNQKASPSSRDYHSPLSYATSLGKAEIVELLLEYGARL